MASSADMGLRPPLSVRRILYFREGGGGGVAENCLFRLVSSTLALLPRKFFKGGQCFLAFFYFCSPPSELVFLESERTSEMLFKRRSAFLLLLLLITAAAALSQAAGWGSQNGKAEGVPPATPEPTLSTDPASEATPAPAATPSPRAYARETLEPRKVRLMNYFSEKKGQRRGESRESLFFCLV